MDTSSTSETLLQYGRFVRELARALVRDPDAADDVAQDVWMQWLRRGRAPVAPRGWLRRAVQSVASNRRRAAERRSRHEALGAREEEPRSPDDEAARAELLHRVVDAVFALGSPYRETILARYFHGRSARELAAESGTPLATVKSRERRALEILRAELDRAYGERKGWAIALASATGAELVLPASLGAGALLVLIGLSTAAGLVAWLGWRTIAVRSTSSPVEHPMAEARAAASHAFDATPARAAGRPAGQTRVALETAASGGTTDVLTGTTVDLEGRPLGAVRVRFLRVAEADPLAEALSDAQGHFEVEGLAWFHTVTAEREGYRFLYASEPEEDPLDPWRPMRVTLCATSTLVVNVRDTSGTALEGVAVSARPRWEELEDSRAPWGTLSQPQAGVEAETDAHGRAVLTGAWEGVKLELRLDLESGVDSGEVTVDRERDGQLVLVGAAGNPIVARAGRTLELEAVWSEPRVVRGVVLDAEGNPAPDCNVEAHDHGLAPLDGRLAFGQSDAEGRFELCFQPPALHGPVRLVASRTGALHDLGPNASRRRGPWAQRGGIPSALEIEGATVAVPAEKVERLLALEELDAAEPLVLSLGPLEAGVLTGTVFDAAGEPLQWRAMHQIQLLTASSGILDYHEAGLGLSNGGGFVVFGLPDGSYDVLITLNTKSSSGPCFTRFPGLSAGSEGLQLRLEERAPVELVVDRSGGPGQLCAMRFFPQSPNSLFRPTAARELTLAQPALWLFPFEEIDSDEGTWVSSTVEIEQVFEIPLGDPGWYALGFDPEDASRAPVASELLWFDEGRITITFEPRVLGVVRGRLIADGSSEFLGLTLADDRGRPVPVAAPEADAQRWVVRPIRTSGEFLLRDLPSGRYRLRFGSVEELASGRFRREVALEVLPGENAPLEVEL